MRASDDLADSHAQYQAGRAHMAAGRLQDAVEAFRRSIDKYPHFKTLELLGECYMHLGAYARAIPPLAAATTLNRQSRAPALLAEAFEQLEEVDRAVEMALLALERGKDNRRATAVLARHTVTLYRPVGPEELSQLKASGFRAWPPRLPGQPLFYPVTTAAYAVEIASNWNVKESGAGFVTRFRVRRAFMQRYDVHKVGGHQHAEWWVPAEDLEELNENIVGEIEVIEAFEPPAYQSS